MVNLFLCRPNRRHDIHNHCVDKSDGSEKIKLIYSKQIDIFKDSINLIGKRLYTSDIDIKGIHGAEIAPYWTEVPQPTKNKNSKFRNLVKRIFT